VCYEIAPAIPVVPQLVKIHEISAKLLSARLPVRLKLMLNFNFERFATHFPIGDRPFPAGEKCSKIF
jgi:hypothetical protein